MKGTNKSALYWIVLSAAAVASFGGAFWAHTTGHLEPLVLVAWGHEEPLWNYLLFFLSLTISTSLYIGALIEGGKWSFGSRGLLFVLGLPVYFLGTGLVGMIIMAAHRVYKSRM